MNYKDFCSIRKQAAAVMTDEAIQAAAQPPMDPAMAQAGAPMDPAMMGGAPAGASMGPEMAGGMPPAAGGAPITGVGGGQIPPEILQDQAFMQFLMQLGIQVDPVQGVFLGPDGQPLPVDIIMQAYQEFKAQEAQMVQGAPSGAPMDPAMMGGVPAPAPAPMDPAMMQGGVPPIDPSTAAPVPAPMDPAPAQPEATPAEPAQDPVMLITDSVTKNIEGMLQDFTANIEKQMSAMLDKISALSNEISSLQHTADERTKIEKDQAAELQEELAAELQPTVAKQAAVKKVRPARVSLYDRIRGY